MKQEEYPSIKIPRIRHTKEALKWIAGILRERKVRFEITGGLAAELYGSRRPLADIDIDISEKDFGKIIPTVKKHIVFGPKIYKDKNWWLLLLTLNYKGQLIDLCGIEHTKIFDHTKKKWVPLRNNLFKHAFKKFAGLRVPVTTRRELLNYKKKLWRRVDKIDVKELEKQN
jgi:hypothetical protein